MEAPSVKNIIEKRETFCQKLRSGKRADIISKKREMRSMQQPHTTLNLLYTNIRGLSSK
jgi:hypothetical protein